MTCQLDLERPAVRPLVLSSGRSFHSARMSRGLDRRWRLGSRTDARTPGGVDCEDRVSIIAGRMWWRLP
jgi:hypothetical protein